MTIEGVRRVVAVKVRHPGVADIIRRDFQVFISAATSCYRAVTYHWRFLGCLVSHDCQNCSIHKPCKDKCTERVALIRAGWFCKTQLIVSQKALAVICSFFILFFCSFVHLFYF